MSKEIFIKAGDELALKAYVPIASHLVSSIGDVAAGVDEIDDTFSLADLSILLDKVSVHMSGEFAIHRTPSKYCQIVYEPYVFDPAEFDEGYISTDLVGTRDPQQNSLWINERVLFAFIDRKLYGVAFTLYFYLGHLMTRDDAFGISHNISFKQILESCDEFPESWRVKHRTTLMRAIADLQDARLIKWNETGGTFELLHITAYDPNQRV